MNTYRVYFQGWSHVNGNAPAQFTADLTGVDADDAIDTIGNRPLGGYTEWRVEHIDKIDAQGNRIGL